MKKVLQPLEALIWIQLFKSQVDTLVVIMNLFVFANIFFFNV